MILTVLDDEMKLSRSTQYSLVAQFQRWFSAFCIAYAVEFACLSVAKLMVLSRLTDFAAYQVRSLNSSLVTEGRAVRFLVVGGRVVMALVVVGNAVGVCSNVAAAVYYQRAADHYSAASGAFFANNTVDASRFLVRATEQLDLAFPTESLQEFCEVVVLTLIVIAFTAAGTISYLRIRSAMSQADQAAAVLGKQLRWQIVGTVAFVFVTFLLRASYSIMIALSNHLMGKTSNSSCPSRNRCDASCFNDYRLMQVWMLYTPQFPLTVILISSPLALLVTLRGMTSGRQLKLLRSNPRDGMSLQGVSVGEGGEGMRQLQ